MLKILKKFIGPKINTAIHPKYKKLVEKIAEIDGRGLYMFKSLLDMPHIRYNHCSRFSTEFNMKLDSEILRESISQLRELLIEPTKKSLTKASEILILLDEHTKMLISIDSSYRLASCVYFWEDEDLNDYDFLIGDEKIELFKKYKFDDFFLSEPMNRFLPQMNLSVNDLHIYSRYEKELQKLLSSTLKDKIEKATKQI